MHRIGLLGGECTGKSTLAQHLAARLPDQTVVIPEVLRSFVIEQHRAPLPHEQAGIMARQRQAEEDAARDAGSDVRWLIADPAPAMTAIYSQIYFDDDSLLASARMHLRSYDVLLWCDRDLPWLPEPGQRDGAHMRDAAHEAIATAFGDLRLHPLHGDAEQRLVTALRIIGQGV